MKITFRCACNRKYSVPEDMAGKAVRCAGCGAMRRVPRPGESGAAPTPAPSMALAMAAAPSSGDWLDLDESASPDPDIDPSPASSPSASGGARRPTWGRWALEGFLESIPRGGDWRLPAAGAVALVAAVALAAAGGVAAQLAFVVALPAAMAVILWASVAGLVAAWRQGAGSALALLPGLAAMLQFFIVVVVPGLTPGRLLAGAAPAAACLAAFFVVGRRGERYRRPVALGILATLLVAATAVTASVARTNLARRGSADPPAGVAGANSPARPDGATPAPQADTVDRALRAGGTPAEARSGFRPKPFRNPGSRDPLDAPPPGVFDLIHYESPIGPMAAYLTPDPGDGRKRPAIVWITGGDCNSIGEVWKPRAPSNDQTAAAYREAGIALMFPSLRGAHDNPGEKEGFLGEVDDVLAAADFLAKQPHVDPGRIYLGGHSTGGTLALLAAESTGRFRAVFAFGPVDDVRGYEPDGAHFDLDDPREVVVRSPGYWLHAVRSPTFVIEGDGGNIEVLRAMRAKAKNPLLLFFEIPDTDHFAVLAPANRRIAAKILADDGPTSNLAFTPEELAGPAGR